ncbi:hypothetical protein LINPERPRIM_LOCUS7902 [Linum perenne]
MAQFTKTPTVQLTEVWFETL